MKILLPLLVGIVVLLPLKSVAEDAKDEAVKKEYKQFEGKWQFESMEWDGSKFPDEQSKNWIVIVEADGKWSITEDGKVFVKGTSEIDPGKKPKTVDLTHTEGNYKGQKWIGIYEIGDSTRKICFGVADKARPTEFAAPSGSGYALVVLKRVKK